MFSKAITVFMAAGILVGQAWAESPLDKAHMGPVFKEFGPVFDVPNSTYDLKNDVHYKAVMDLSVNPEGVEGLNKNLESAARFINMSVGAGADPANIEFAFVVHGPATRDIMSDEASIELFGQPNPNTALLYALNKAGVKVYLCGQSTAYRGLTLEQMNPIATMATSAMTAHVRLQAEGYSLIPF